MMLSKYKEYLPDIYCIIVKIFGVNYDGLKCQGVNNNKKGWKPLI